MFMYTVKAKDKGNQPATTELTKRTPYKTQKNQSYQATMSDGMSGVYNYVFNL